MASSSPKISNLGDTNLQTTPVVGQILKFDSISGVSKWVNEGILMPTAKTANYTAVAGDHVLANATSGPITVTLPSAATATAGAWVRVTKTDSSTNGVIVNPPTGNLNGLTVSGSLTNTASKTSNYTAASLDNVQCDASSGSFTVTLPAATAGRWVRVTKIDSSVNTVLVAPPSGTIDGDVNASVNRRYYGQNFVADGTSWHYLPDTYANTFKQMATQDFVSDGTGWWAV
jgi:hypothetical protein